MMLGLGLALACCSAANADAAEDKREENIRRMLQITTATGRAAPSMPSATYAKKLALAIKHNIRFDTEIEGNPVAVVRAETEIDGRIKSRHLVQSSGVGEWDTAVLNAIDRTERFPIEANETLPRAIEFHMRPKE
jgi:colicin import membrane protein